MAFWALYNSYLPRNLLRFMHYFLKWTITWHKEGIKKAALDNHGDDPDVANNFKNNEHRRFFEEDLYNHFVIQFGLILIIQGFVLFVALIVYIIYSMKRKALLPENFS